MDSTGMMASEEKKTLDNTGMMVSEERKHGTALT